LEARSLLIGGLLCALGGVGCLRLGYENAKDSAGAKGDAGAHDAGATTSGGRGGSGGVGGRGGVGGAGTGGKPSTSEDSGSSEAGTGGDAGPAVSDAEVTPSPIDASSDAEVIEDPGDAAAADGGMPIVSKLCPERPGALFCDGFEDADFERWSFTVNHNGTLTRSTERAHSGTTSLRAATGPPDDGTEARWATLALANQKSGDAWLRFYSWVPSTVVVTEHFSIGIMSEGELPYAGFELRLRPTLVDINASSQVFPGTKTFPRDRWVCVELHVRIDETAGVYEAYLDQELAVRSPAMNTRPAMGYSAAEVGIHYADRNQGPVEVYTDDVVVGTARIPCD
jgi:hypothetical protein